MHPRTIYFLCCHIPGTFLSVFYIAIIVFLFKRRNQYGSSFYTLFIFGGIIDLLTYVIVTLFTSSSSVPFVANFAASIQRIDNSSEWLTYSPYLSIFFSSTYFIPYSQDCTNLVIAINRFTAIASPAKYRKIWKDKYTKCYILFVLLLAFLLSLNTFGAPVFFYAHPNLDDSQMWLSIQPDNSRLISNGQLTLICILFFYSSAMLLYLLTALLMCRSRKSNGSEVKLCMFGIMLWFCSLPAVGFQLYFAMGGLNADVVTYGYSPIIMTKSLTPPLLLILTNTNLRADFRTLFSGRQTTTVGLSTTVSS